ncbi:MAG: c-type cytochrome biogenesis protein CcmI, partial [Proteobacteria bacterium]|nr:c-type cytochrome biogenesis protein CcmI [Pseudomonadota bacterium]
MMVFVVVAALMLAAALAFVLTPLLRGSRTGSSNDTRRLLALLDESHKNGILSDAEYTAKRAELGERLLGA